MIAAVITSNPAGQTSVHPQRSGQPRVVELPQVSPRLLQFFTHYSRRLLAKSFHALRISTTGELPALGETPLVVYANHSSWWDPLVGLVLARDLLPERTLFAPIDATALERYKVFKRLGFFGVETDSIRGAATFLRSSQAVLAQPGAMLWLTPQGRFSDPRERPLRFKPGLGHLAARLENAIILPLAVEYSFWEERTPEILLRFGDPVHAHRTSATWNAHEWTHQLEHNLEVALSRLAAEAQRRDPASFRTLLQGRAGVGGVYDQWRAWRARWRGEPFRSEHGQL